MTVFGNVKWGIRRALFFALVFSTWIAVLMLLRRSVTLGLDRGDTVNGFAVMGLYLLGALCVGLVIGVLRPVMRRPLGAALAGAIAALPLEIGVIVLVRGPGQWGRIELYAILTFALVMGVPSGLILWNIFSDEPAERLPGSR